MAGKQIRQGIIGNIADKQGGTNVADGSGLPPENTGAQEANGQANPPIDDPDTQRKNQPKNSAEWQKEYDAILKEVQRADRAGAILRQELMKEVETKVQRAAGDLKALMERKRAITAQLHQAKDREASLAAK